MRSALLLTPMLLSSPAHAYTAEQAHALAGAIAGAWAAQVPPQSQEWNWKPGVLAIGMRATWGVTADPALPSWVQAWVDFHMAGRIYVHKSDQVVPCTSALWLFELTGDDTYLEPVQGCEDYLELRAPRLSDGAYAHAALLPNQIWMDSLFMLGSFWIASGQHEAAAQQFELFAGHLMDERTHLYRHMYEEVLDLAYPVQPVFWGRGNGWVLASLAMLLTELPPGESYDRLSALFQAHAAAVMSYQDPSGRWSTVVNGWCESYLETSATALFSFGLLRGHHLGLLPDAARVAGERGVDTLFDQVRFDPDGWVAVTEISGSTNPGPCPYYANVPLKEDEPHGVGAVLMALSER